jgi:hypothetical protein
MAMLLNCTTPNLRCSRQERTSFVFSPFDLSTGHWVEHISARSYQSINSAQSAAPKRAQIKQTKIRRTKSSRVMVGSAKSRWFNRGAAQRRDIHLSCMSKSRRGELMISVSASRCTAR